METGGIVKISLQPGGEAGWCYYSEPVVLMPEEGELWIETALVQPDQKIIFGSSLPFADCDYTEEPVRAEIGALLDPARSSFRIGLCLLEDTEQESVEVCWRAVRKTSFAKPPAAVLPEAEEETTSAPDLYIDAVPGFIGKNRKFMFVCHLPEGMDETVTWSVEGEDAGTIDSYGMYTAPDRVGVFEVKAAAGDRVASAFVVVKDTEEIKR